MMLLVPRIWVSISKEESTPPPFNPPPRSVLRFLQASSVAETLPWFTVASLIEI